MRKAVTHVEGNGHVVFSLPEAALESVHVCCRQGHGGLLRDASLICSIFVMTKLRRKEINS